MDNEVPVSTNVDNLAVGDKVYLNTPDNQRLHGQEGTVVAITDWGAHVATGVGGGGYRAFFSEMVKKPENVDHTSSSPTPKPIKANKSNHSTHSATTSGYTGDVCVICQGARMRRNGACLLCEDCGSTSGCS